MQESCRASGPSGAKAKTVFVPQHCSTFDLNITTPLVVGELLVSCPGTVRGLLVVHGPQHWEGDPAYAGKAVNCATFDVRFDSLELRGTHVARIVQLQVVSSIQFQ